MMRDRRLWLMLAAALAVRLVLMPRPDPVTFDLTVSWVPWMRYGAEHGVAQLYLHGQPPVNYPPLFLLLLSLLGKLYGQLAPDFAYTPLQSALIKLPAVLADLTVGVLLYVAAVQTRREDRVAPLLAAGLWLFNPAVVYVSSVWGQVDSLHTLWMLAALMAALNKRWSLSGLLLGLALLTKLQAIFVAPLLLLLAWWGGWRAMLRWAGWTAVTLVVGLAPLWADGALGPVRAAYLGAIGYYPALSMNAFNPWFVVQVIGPRVLGYGLEDTARVLGPITLRWLGLGLLAGYGLLLLWVLARRWRPGATQQTSWSTSEQWSGAFLAAGLLVFGFFMLATEMHERYLLPALAFLALPAAFRRQERGAYLLLAVTTTLNLVRVLPFSPGVLRLFEGIPDDRILISLANTALFGWWTWLYLRAKPEREVSGA